MWDLEAEIIDHGWTSGPEMDVTRSKKLSDAEVPEACIGLFPKEVVFSPMSIFLFVGFGIC